MAINNLIAFRKGTSAEWNNANPILASGEPGYDLTNSILKIGDGSKTWTQLSGIGSSGVGGGGGSGVNISNYGNNRILTSDGTSTGINAESSLSFDGNTFSVNPTGSSFSSFSVNATGVSLGQNSYAYSSGQIAIANGKFSTDGDAQVSQYVFRNQTTGNAWTNLFNNGASGVFLKPNKTYSFLANIVGRCTSVSNNAAYKLEGLVVNDINSPSIIGTPIKTILGETDSSWDVRSLISGTNLVFQVQGSSSQDINWVAGVYMVENGGLLADAYVQSFSSDDITIDWV